MPNNKQPLLPPPVAVVAQGLLYFVALAYIVLIDPTISATAFGHVRNFAVTSIAIALPPPVAHRSSTRGAANATTKNELLPLKPTHAIVVPYRNRSYHLESFQEYMGPYLRDNFPNDSFALWVVEQANSDPFNRGWLANVGIASVKSSDPATECVIFHDVDLIPSNETNATVPYNHCDRPVQLGSELEHWNWSVPYEKSAGGVVSLSLDHWYRINGFSNEYEGWGGEDDDLFLRLRMNQLLDNVTNVIDRPAKGRGVLHTISESSEHHPKDYQRGLRPEYKRSMSILNEMRRGSDRWKVDGLSSLNYISVLDVQNFSVPGFQSAHFLRVQSGSWRTAT